MFRGFPRAFAARASRLGRTHIVFRSLGQEVLPESNFGLAEPVSLIRPEGQVGKQGLLVQRHDVAGEARDALATGRRERPAAGTPSAAASSRMRKRW